MYVALLVPQGKDKTTSTALLAGMASSFFLLRKGTEANITAGTRAAVAVGDKALSEIKKLMFIRQQDIKDRTMVLESDPTAPKG